MALNAALQKMVSDAAKRYHAPVIDKALEDYRNGSIDKAGLIERVAAAYGADPSLPSKETLGIEWIDHDDDVE